MLETPQERVKLLKAGITGKTIERLYLRENNFKIVSTPFFSDPFEIYTKESRNNVINQKFAVESGLPRKTEANHHAQILQPVCYLPAKKSA